MHRAEYILWLKNMGLSSAGKLLPAIEYFSSPEEIYNADREAIEDCGMFNEAEIEYLLKKDTSFVSAEIERCNKERCYLVDYFSKFYPEALKEIPEPPLMLYVKGSREALKYLNAVTIVGSRSATGYGVSVAQELSGAFGAAGCTVVSGMAHGIDSSVASGALNAGGRVIGVLCSGIDVDYPTGSEAMREKIIASGGALITEFPMGTAPQSGYFRIRNRIMAGLSDLTVVVEAGEKSGALITAKLAEKYARRVAAVPNPIDSASGYGANSLIASGAEMVLNVAAFVSDYVKEHTEEEKKAPEEIAPEPEVIKPSGKKAVSDGNTESDNMMELTELLENGPLMPAQLAEKSGRNIKWVNSTLIILEVSGRVKRLPDGRYSL